MKENEIAGLKEKHKREIENLKKQMAIEIESIKQQADETYRYIFFVFACTVVEHWYSRTLAEEKARQIALLNEQKVVEIK